MVIPELLLLLVPRLLLLLVLTLTGSPESVRNKVGTDGLVAVSVLSENLPIGVICITIKQARRKEGEAIRQE